MTDSRTSGLIRWTPGLFVLLWSTGFVAARYATIDAGPLSFLAARFVCAASILWVVAVVIRAPRIERRQVGWASATAVGMHVLYLGGIFWAIAQGLPTGLSALIAGLHPVVTSVAGRWVLGERLSTRQWFGIGLGVIGVVVVVIDRMQAQAGDVTGPTLIAMVVAVVGMAAGTLVQRGRGATMPLVRGTAVQYTSAAAILLVAAVADEGWDFHPSARLWFSLGWAVLVLSIAAVLIMMMLLQRQAAAKVSSLFFLTPALSTIEGAWLFSERLGALAWLGLVVALFGVFLTTQNRSMQNRSTQPGSSQPV
ncbi:MAG: DMT family transporter [Ilumatobacteraceae bacterium]